MNKIKLNPYINLTNDQLLDFTIEEMNKLKVLSLIGNIDEYERGISIVNQLIIEVKRRNLSIKKPLLAKRIFNK
jgi:hypothetical protein